MDVGSIHCFIIVIVEILFDTLGTAATAADEAPLNAISGIISGSALTILIIEITSITDMQEESVDQIV